MIVETARKNLKRSQEYSKSVALPNPEWRWQSYCCNTMRWVNLFREPLEVIHSIQSPQSNAGYKARMGGQSLVKHVQLMEDTCLRLFPKFAKTLTSFRETALSYPDTITTLNERLVSTPLYNHIIHIMRICNISCPNSVLEIGGGYGAPGRLWLTNELHQPQIYINVDFPESLFYAEVYLRATLPNHEIFYVHTKEDVETAFNFTDSHRIVLVPISQLDKLTTIPIDLLVNTGSLQEMSQEYVNFYMDWLHQSQIHSFYSSNYFGQALDKLMEGMNYCAPIMGAEWKPIFSVLHDDTSRPVAEQYFTRDMKYHDHEDEILDIIHQDDPISLSHFLQLFNAVRHVSDPRIIMQVIYKGLRMSHIPKEVLFLARLAQDIYSNTKNNFSDFHSGAFPWIGIADQNKIIKTNPMSDFSNIDIRIKKLIDSFNVEDHKKLLENIVVSLQQLAISGIHSMGIVDATVSDLRDQGLRNESTEISLIPNGRLHKHPNSTVSEIEGRLRLVEGIHGAVDYLIGGRQCLLLAEFKDSSVGYLANGDLFLESA